MPHPRWRLTLVVGALTLALYGCVHPQRRESQSTTRPEREVTEREVAELLLDLHRAAATADFDGYFGLFHEAGSFLGTDATERWSVEAFKEYARPHFGGDSAWVFVPVEQNVTLSDDGTFAWFDERLESASYGECRGSGVVFSTASGWKIGQYNLTVPIPNELLGDFVARIRGEIGSPTRVVLVRHAEKALDAGDDPHLTERGRRRADRLATILAEAPAGVIFHTDYHRTRETVATLARSQDLVPIEVEAGDVTGLAEHIRDEHEGELVVYAGHSNTVPTLIRALGVESKISIEDHEYDDVFVVTLGAQPTVVQLRIPLEP